MAKRYFNVFKNHVAVLVTLVVLICVSAFTEGTVSTLATITAGVIMIYSAISYAIWLLKTPTANMKEENS